MRFLLSKWYVIFIFAVIGAGAGWAYDEFFQTPKYKSSASLLFQNKKNTVTTAKINNYLEIIKSRRVVESALSSSQINGLSYEDAANSLETNTPKDTQFVSISVITADAGDSQILLENIIRAFEKEAKEIYDLEDEISIVDSPNRPASAYNVNEMKQIMIAAAGSSILVMIVLFFSYDIKKTKEETKKAKQQPQSPKDNDKESLPAKKPSEDYRNIKEDSADEAAKKKIAPSRQSAINVKVGAGPKISDLKTPGSAYGRSGKKPSVSVRKKRI